MKSNKKKDIFKSMSKDEAIKVLLNIPKSCKAYIILLCTGFNPSLTSGNALFWITSIE